MKNLQIEMIPIEKLQRGRFQPRRHFDEESLQELANSIELQGIIEPIIVRPITDKSYEIIAGERRWRAAQLAKLQEVPCIVRYYSDSTAAEIAIIENIQREDLNPIEEASSYQRLIDEFGCTHEEVAIAVGKSREKITNALRLLKLHANIREMIEKNELSSGHGKVLAGVEEEYQLELAKFCVKYQWSVRKLEQEAKKLKEQPKKKRSENEPDIAMLERLVSEQLGTEVKVEPSGSYLSGELRIRYFSNDTLAGILDKLGVKYND